MFVPSDTYDHKEAQIVLRTNQGSKISLSTRSVIGGFFGGDRVNLSGTLRVRASEMFTTQFSLSYNNISLLVIVPTVRLIFWVCRNSVRT